MKNLIKRLGSGRGRVWSMSSSEDGSSDKLKQPVQHRISKRISRRQQQDPKDINRRSQQRQESRSDSKSPGHRNQHHYQQSRRESGIRDLFQFSSSGEQTPQRTSRQQRHQAVSRTTDASYDAQQQQHHFIGDNVYYDENQHHFLSYNHHHQQYQHEHYQRDFEPVGLVRLVQSTSPLSFYGPGSSPDNGHISRPPPQQNHHHHQQQQHKFEFDSDGVNFFTHDEDNGRVRFLSSSSSVSSSVSEEPSQVHMMAGCGQSVASSSCMSGSSSYYLNSKGDLAIFGKAMRSAKHDDEERLRAMGLVSTNQDETTSGRTSPEHPSLPRMRNEQFEARSESEYHDVRDEEIHHDHALPSSVSAPRASAPSSRSGPPSNDRMGNQEGNEMKNEFSMTSISKWSSSYIC